MKKLMITAAVAAMVSGAFALNEAQVYDFTATIKTGVCSESKVSAALAKYFNERRFFPSTEALNYDKGDEIGLRKQKSQKLAGVIWGCDCETIADPKWGPVRITGASRQYIRGYMFWNQSVRSDSDRNGMLYTPWSLFSPRRTRFAWTVLNRIDTMSKCEGSFVLSCRWPLQQIFIMGAGFGSVKKTGCDTYISSISGNIAGFAIPAADTFGCVYCAASGCVVTPICDTCWEFDTRTLSAATGTWKIKYNSSATKRLRSNPFISRTYNFGNKSGYAREFANFAEQFNIWLVRNNLLPVGNGDSDDVWTEKMEDKFEEYVEAVDYDEDDYLDGIVELAEEWSEEDAEIPSAVQKLINEAPDVVSQVITEAEEEALIEADSQFDTAIAKILGDLS